MSQINPFRGVVMPPAVPPRVQPQKDRQQRRGGNDERHGHEEQPDNTAETKDDGKPHIDLKA